MEHFFRFVKGAATWFGIRSKIVAQQELAADHGSKFQIIYHELDEPISGLMASTQTGPELLGRHSENSEQSFLARLRSSISNLFTSPANEFAWKTLVRKIQGSDIAFEDLERVVAYPDNFDISKAPLSPELSTRMENSALENSLQTVRDIRRKLNESASLNKAVDSLKALSSAVSWSAFIHNSYFDFSEIRTSIYRKINQTQNTAIRQTDANSTLPVSNAFRHHSSMNVTGLSVAKGLILIAFMLSSSLFSLFIDTTSFRPLTNRFTAENVAERFADAVFIGRGYHPFVAEGFVRAYAMGKADLGTLNTISDDNARLLVEQRLSYALGFKGDDSEFREMLSQKTTDKNSTGPWVDYQKFLLLTFFIAGSLDREVTPDQSIYKMYTDAAEGVSLHGTRSRTMILTLAPRLANYEDDKYLSTFLSSIRNDPVNCEEAAQAALDLSVFIRAYVWQLCRDRPGVYHNFLDQLDQAVSEISSDSDPTDQLPDPPEILYPREVNVGNFLINTLGHKLQGSDYLRNLQTDIECWIEAWENDKRLALKRIFAAISIGTEKTKILNLFRRADASDDHVGNYSALSCILARSGNFQMAALAAERAGRINATSDYHSPVNYEGLHGGYVSILTEYMNNNPTPIS